MKKIAEMRALLRSALALDIFDITYEHTNEQLAILDFGGDAHPREGLLTRLASYLYWTGKHARMRLQRRGRAIAPGSVVFFANSKNEYDSLSPVCSRMEDGHFIGTWGRARNNLNLFLSYLVGLAFLPRVLGHMRRSQGYQRVSFSYILDQYLIGYGVYCVGRLWFRASRPALFVVANHLVAINRALLKAAQQESIPTLYVLHATISDIYPPLNMDYALLEGMDTLRKYDVLGQTRAKAFLVGMAKHDRYCGHINTSSEVRTVGVCINGLDPSHRVEELCERIAASFPMVRTIVRPHPADRRGKRWVQLANKLGFEYSDWRTEAAFEFLARVDVNIAGESGIHLEAALSNVVPLYYDFDAKKLDLYGFLRNGLVDFADGPAMFTEWMQKLLDSGKPQCRHRAKSYCATVETQWDCRSAELAHSVIDGIKRTGHASSNGWLRIPAIGLEAYEPAVSGASEVGGNLDDDPRIDASAADHDRPERC